MSRQLGNYQFTPQAHSIQQMLPRHHGSYRTTPRQHDHDQPTPRQYSNHRTMPRSTRNRPIARRQALEASLEWQEKNPDTRTMPIDHRQAIEKFLGGEVPDLEGLRIDEDAVRAEWKANAIRPNRTRVANINSEINRNVQNPLHFLRLPQEIRLKIYDILFHKAKMTFTPRARRNLAALIRRGQSDVFKRENMPTNILFVCKDVQAEALSSLFANLTIVEDNGAHNFAQIVSTTTQARAQEIWNMDPHFAFSIFPNMRLWILSENYLINGRVWTEFTNLNSNQMFTNAIGELGGAEMPGKDFLSLVRVAPRSRHTFFVGKINLLCCYKVGEWSNNCLFRVTMGRPVCHDKHESIGHVYLDFVKEQAFFDQGNLLGHDASILALRRV